MSPLRHHCTPSITTLHRSRLSVPHSRVSLNLNVQIRRHSKRYRWFNLAFLINHSTEYHIAMVGAVIEYLVESYLFPSLKVLGPLNLIAFISVVAFQALRTSAMCTAASNFSHMVQFRKDKHHVLVTHGIYSYLRHPSYTAFFYWGISLQLLLLNPICLFAYTFALHKFFAARIEEEEETLVEFFGDEYVAYRKRTHTCIPLID